MSLISCPKGIHPLILSSIVEWSFCFATLAELTSRKFEFINSQTLLEFLIIYIFKIWQIIILSKKQGIS